MKAMPFTKGHQYLIDTAIKNSDKVTVVVGSLPKEPIPGEIRYKWVKDQYSTNPNVTVCWTNEVLPQYPEQDPENFWYLWCEVARKFCPKDLDVIFTSETYGDTYAQHLGIKHHMVDRKRNVVPVSGTMVRNDPFSVWDYIPDHVKPYFVKRIAIMGSESCGKSTLTKQLAKLFNTVYVEEYGRTVWEQNDHGTFNSFSRWRFLDIINGRQIIEDALIKQANKLLFCDTEDLTTYLFYDMYYPNDINSVCNDIRIKLKETVDSKPNYDLYILLKPDCDAVQDGTRQFLDARLDHYNKLKKEMTNRDYRFVEVGGSWENRYSESVRIINEMYKVKTSNL